MNNTDFRIRITERNIARGVQDPRDAEIVRIKGVVTRPHLDLSREVTREQAKTGRYAKRDL